MGVSFRAISNARKRESMTVAFWSTDFRIPLRQMTSLIQSSLLSSTERFYVSLYVVTEAMGTDELEESEEFWGKKKSSTDKKEKPKHEGIKDIKE